MWVMPDALAGTLGSPFGERLIELVGRAPREASLNAGALHCAVGRRDLQEIQMRAEQVAEARGSRRGARCGGGA